ncbi:hypothetical protein PVAG01_00536 [Phlyctema vagabunda]|uniref:Peptidase M20 dimerisation domain-containing protein n=1 Tax=Phlyctema vagabunda TaxID=108571 RepID=A0ABR4PV47_9HELO
MAYPLRDSTLLGNANASEGVNEKSDYYREPELSIIETQEFDEKFYHASGVDSASSTNSPKSEHGIRANGPRLWHDLHHTAQWGAIPGSMGMARLTLSDEDKAVRDWFVKEARSFGCQIKIDGIGNIFAVLPGRNNDLAPIAMGSHLDTQPAGGRFDGILGVLSGLEVLRTIKESGELTYAPIAVVVWTNEEGARFNPGCTGSAVWAGWTRLSDALKQTDSEGASIESELSRIGYAGPYLADHRMNPLSAHFELHIEQGPRLEKASKQIGVVCGVQGIRWYTAKVTGERAHAGSTPMSVRSDAVVGAAEIITLLRDRATELNGFATVGCVHVDRASSNTIAGDVTFSIDLRHRSAEGLEAMERNMRDRMEALTLRSPGLHFSLAQRWESPAVRFDDSMLSCVRAAASNELGVYGFIELDSNAGHDSVLTAACGVPSAMIFVPSKAGLSHCPEEFTSEEDCTVGVQVLLDSVLRYDDAVREYLSR